MKKIKISKKVLSLLLVTMLSTSSLINIPAYASTNQNSNTDKSTNKVSEDASSSDIYDAFNLNDEPITYKDTDVNPYGLDKTNILTFSELLMTDNISGGGIASTYDYDATKANSILDNKISETNTKDNFMSSVSEGIDLLNSGKDSYVAKAGISNAVDDDNYSLYLNIEDANGNVLTSTLVSNFECDDDIEGYYLSGLLSMTAGNYDDDDIKEIAVYAPNNTNGIAPAVYIYDVNVTTNGDSTAVEGVNLTKKQEIVISDYNHLLGSPNYSNDDEHRPAVNLVSGDLTQNDKDELVITSSYTLLMDNKDIDNATAVMVPVTTVFSYTESGFKDVYTVSNTWNYTGVDGDAQVKHSSYGSATIGDFDGDLSNELIIAGYDMEGTDPDSDDTDIVENTVNLQMVKYSLDTNSFVLNPYKIANTDAQLGVSVTINENLADGLDEDYVQPPVPMKAVAILSETVKSQVFIGGKIYDFNTANNSYTEIFNADGIYPTDSQVDYGGSNHSTENIWIESIEVGNFYNDNTYADQVVFTVGRRRLNHEQFRHELVVISKDSNGNIVNQMYLINNDKNTPYFKNVDLVKLDLDNDSVILDYKDRTQFFSDPQVYAVLQAAPYFTDLASVEPDYKEDGETVLGMSSGESTEIKNSLELEASLIAGAEDDVSIFVEIAGVKATVELGGHIGYEREKVDETVYSVSYKSDSRTDRVVLGMVPYIKYEYEMYIPEFDMPTEEEYEAQCEALESDEIALENYKAQVEGALSSGYNFGDHVEGLVSDYYIGVPQDFRTSLMDVEIYEEVAEEYGYESIKEEVITNTVGDPYSYDHSSENLNDYTGGKKIDKDGELDDTSAFIPVPQGGGEISQEIEYSSEVGNGVSWGINLEGEAEINILGVIFGGSLGIKYDGSAVYSDLTTTTMEGTVTGIPEKTYNDYTYDFTWQFGQWTDTIDNQSCIVLGFLTNEVTSPPSNVTDLRVLETTDTTATLVWENPTSNPPNYFEVQIANSGSEQYTTIAKVNYSKNSVVLNELSPNSKYNVRVKAVTQADESPYTNTVVAETQPTPGDNVPVAEHLEDYYAYTNTNAYFSTVITSAQNGGKVSYQWQKLIDDTYGVLEWADIKGETRSDLTLENVTTKDNETEYRCKISQMVDGNVVSIYTNSATLYVKAGLSDIELSLSREYGATSQDYTYEEQELKHKEQFLNATYNSTIYKVLEDDSTGQFILQSEYSYYAIEQNSETDNLINKAIADNSFDVLLTNTEDFIPINARYVYIQAAGQFGGQPIIFNNEVVFTEDNRTIFVAGRPVQISGIYTEDYKTLYYAQEDMNGEMIETYYYQENPAFPIVPAQKEFIDYEDDRGNIYNANDFHYVSTDQSYYETVDYPVSVVGDEVELRMDISALTNIEGIIPDGTIEIEVYNSNSGDMIESMKFDIDESTGENNKNSLTYGWTPKKPGEYIVSAKYYGDSNLTASFSNEVTYQAIQLTSPESEQTFKMFTLDAPDETEVNSPVELDAYTQVNNITVENKDKIVDNQITREEVDLSKVTYEVTLSNGESAEGKYTIEDNVFTANTYGKYIIKAKYDNDNSKVSSTIVTVKPDVQDDIFFVHNEFTMYMSQIENMEVLENQLQINSDSNMTFTSDDDKIADIDSDGILQPKSAGTTTITAISSVEGKKDVCDSYELTIVDDTVAVKPASSTNEDDDNNDADNDGSKDNDTNSDNTKDDDNSQTVDGDSSNNDSNNQSGGISTGDVRNITLLILLISISAVAIIITVRKKKKLKK